MKQKLAIVLIALMLIGGWNTAARSQDSPDSPEYLIKAGFIYNFAKLVEWPSSAFTSSYSAIVIGVLGDDSAARVIEDTVSGKKMDNHPFVVKRLKWAKDSTCGCQMLFITSRESAHTDDVLQAHKNLSVLTISETPGYARRGVMINFVLENSQVRFEANVDAARQSGLSISSRLLSLAKIVQTDAAAR